MQTTGELVAGPDLDALVAAKVMGWTPYSGGHYYGVSAGAPMEMVCMVPGDGAAPHWSPSTNIVAAWQVVEVVSRRVPDEFMLWQESGRWGAEFQDGTANFAETAPLAICRAALKAVAQDGKQQGALAHDSEPPRDLALARTLILADLRSLHVRGDVEIQHSQADNVISNWIMQTDPELAEAYSRVPKWYP